ncbi:hypothetical protein D3C71_1748680 [compost metagenome]
MLPDRIVEGGAWHWAIAADDLQVMTITLWAVGAPVQAVQQQTVERAVLFVFQRHAVYIRRRHRQQVTGCVGVLTIDQAGQLANATAFAETPGKPQHHHLLGQWITLCIALLKAAVLQ